MVILVGVFMFSFAAIDPVRAQLNREVIEFSKTVEPAMIAHGLHNTKGKNTSHQKFFSGRNSMVEFFMNHSFKGSSGFRIDSLDECNYRLEVKWVSNQQEILEKLRKKFPLKSIKAGESFTLTEEKKRDNKI